MEAEQDLQYVGRAVVSTITDVASAEEATRF